MSNSLKLERDSTLYNSLMKTISKHSHLAESGCIEWTGMINENGYGRIYRKNKTTNSYDHYFAHRASYALFRGEIPATISVLHSCDNPLCINPSHLFLGTHLDNIRDKVSKGRQSKGSSCGHNILVEADIIKIRASSLPAKILANLFGVSTQMIYNVKNFRWWKQVSKDAVYE